MFTYAAAVIVIFISVVCNGQPITEPQDSNRVIGGNIVGIDKIPYQVSIHGSKYRMCAGSIISTDWVLTSARCVDRGRSLKIRAGSSKTNQNGTEHKVVRVIKHKEFIMSDHGVPINDIALVKVDPSFQLNPSHTSPVKLFIQNQPLKPNSTGTVGGWGFYTQNDQTYSSELRMVQVKLISKDECKVRYEHFPNNNQVCTYNANAEGPCYGDFGSPLMIEGHQAGIVSHVAHCDGSPRYPKIYTEIAGYRNWILDNTGV